MHLLVLLNASSYLEGSDFTSCYTFDSINKEPGIALNKIFHIYDASRLVHDPIILSEKFDVTTDHEERTSRSMHFPKHGHIEKSKNSWISRTAVTDYTSIAFLEHQD